MVDDPLTLSVINKEITIKKPIMTVFNAGNPLKSSSKLNTMLAAAMKFKSKLKQSTKFKKKNKAKTD